MNAFPILFLVGPTATGKTQTAFELAQRLNGEIISCDAMQIYREINILSDKPSAEILSTVPHHMINIRSVEEEFDVHTFKHLVYDALQQIHSRNKLPIVVGGSGLYMSVLLDGIFEHDTFDDDLRLKLEGLPLDELYTKLKSVDPDAAQKISENDQRRIVRSLEVFECTGKPISKLQKERKGLWQTHLVKVFGLHREREVIYQRVNARVDEMFDEGVLNELKEIKDLNWSKTAGRLIGVREILSHLNGDMGLEETKELIKKNTRNFVKRQLTWFRKEQRIEWIEVNENTYKELAEDISERWKMS